MRRTRPTARHLGRSGAALVVSGVVLLTDLLTATHAALGAGAVPPACGASDSSVADPGAPHGLFVLFPLPTGPDYAAIQQYVMGSSLACGANFYLDWASADTGPGHTPRYNFSAMDALTQPWAALNKIVNIDVWGVGYTAGVNRTTPQYVLGQINTVTCGTGPGSQTLPIYWEPAYEQNWEAFIRAVVDHYQNDSYIGYLRFGIGVGGEDLPASDIGSSTCASKFAPYGYSGPFWVNYTRQLIQFMGSLHSSKQLMVSMNLDPPKSSNSTTADAVAATAVPMGIGIGSQGLQWSDANSTTTGAPCSGDWCRNFALFEGRVPMELQTLYYSCPVSPCSGWEEAQTGSLDVLLPFALQGHTQVFELYWQDWLSALDPAYPTYTSSYLAAFCSTAQVVGYLNPSVACPSPPVAPSPAPGTTGPVGWEGYLLVVGVVVAATFIVLWVRRGRRRVRAQGDPPGPGGWHRGSGGSEGPHTPAERPEDRGAGP